MNRNQLIIKIKKSKSELQSSKYFEFPEKGGVKKSNKQGVYIIYKDKKKVLHVGKTNRAKNGINQRLTNHLYGNSSFTINYLKNEGRKLRKKCYSFKFIEIKDDKERAYLEALLIGSLCPEHIGTGKSEN